MLAKGEMEDVLLISTELNELTATNSYQLTIAPYFSERVISHNLDLQKKYDFVMRDFGTENLRNYRWYFNADMSIEPHLTDLGEIIGQPLKLTIMDQIFNIFKIEKSRDIYFHYRQLIYNLLSIASWM
jgi:hypothetical protein